MLPNRREVLRLIAAAAGYAWGSASAQSGAAVPAQDAFLDELERRGCRYFWEQASSRTGQVRDRALAGGNESRRVASVAATGFGLGALCVADGRGYLPAKDVRERVRTTLDYHLHALPQEHGFFYHFSDIESGERIWKCEVSSIDTGHLPVRHAAVPWVLCRCGNRTRDPRDGSGALWPGRLAVDARGRRAGRADVLHGMEAGVGFSAGALEPLL